MNPSAQGWLKKLKQSLKKHQKDSQSLLDLYPHLKASGFVYGSNVAVANEHFKNSDFTQEERCKLNFTLALLKVYNFQRPKEENFEQNIVKFYKHLGFYKSNFLSDILGTDVESILHKRIQIDDNILTKNFNLYVTNALLFMDVLTFDKFLKNSRTTKEYLLSLENSIRAIISEALNSKSKKNAYDDSLIKLLSSSMRHSKSGLKLYEDLRYEDYSELEKMYFLDLVCMATWSDLIIDDVEREFLDDFGEKFELPSKKVNDALSAVNLFYQTYKDDIALLSTKNLATRFYDHSSIMVKKLITRNSKRIFQELKESKELVKLLSQSTIRDLNEQEQRAMQEQMMDLLKSIPSLAIFMLPGGAFLLPLFIKFIPKLLPSAFDDNRINDE